MKIQLDLRDSYIKDLAVFIDKFLVPIRARDIRFELACQSIEKIKLGQALSVEESQAFLSAEQMMVLQIAMNDPRKDMLFELANLRVL